MPEELAAGSYTGNAGFCFVEFKELTGAVQAVCDTSCHRSVALVCVTRSVEATDVPCSKTRCMLPDWLTLIFIKILKTLNTLDVTLITLLKAT